MAAKFPLNSGILTGTLDLNNQGATNGFNFYNSQIARYTAGSTAYVGSTGYGNTLHYFAGTTGSTSGINILAGASGSTSSQTFDFISVNGVVNVVGGTGVSIINPSSRQITANTVGRATHIGLDKWFLTSLASTGAAGLMSAADKNKLDGITTITSPRILNVSSDGNDTTGDGTIAKPYLTAQKAFDVAFAANPYYYLVKLGSGSYTIACTSWPMRVTVSGAGSVMTSLDITLTNGALELYADKSINISITASSSATGGDGPGINIKNAVGTNVISYGSVGQAGEQGTPGTPETPGGDGTNGSVGGAGGDIRLVDCDFLNVYSIGGAGGAGGAGGEDGGAGSGNPGDAGNNGSRGNFYSDGSRVGSLECSNYYIARTNIVSFGSSTVGSDYGGNSTMPPPF